MIELHERLSEFSYGYGITREVERLLQTVGIRAVPFLPSLLQEKEVGFDVGFGGKGVPVLLQFKLGQSLKRFMRGNLSHPAPSLDRPFFRFSIDTAETDGQYEALLKAQTDGAEVYYVAPRFDDWAQYVELFEQDAVLEHSVMVTPGGIRDALVQGGSADGLHRIVYDASRVYVCSKPMEVQHGRPEAAVERVALRARDERETLGYIVRRIYAGTENRAVIRRREERRPIAESADSAERVATISGQAQFVSIRSQRARRLDRIRSRSRSEDDAITVALGLELWGLGIQLLLAVKND